MIEVQLMRKFLRQQSTSFLDIPDEASSLFELLDTKETGSLKETFKDSDAIVNLQSLANRDIHGSDYSFNPGQSQIKLLPPVLEGVFTSSQMERIKRVYKFLYPIGKLCIQVLGKIINFTAIGIIVIKSKETRVVDQHLQIF